jgi:hypothetical protein
MCFASRPDGGPRRGPCERSGLEVWSTIQGVCVQSLASVPTVAEIRVGAKVWSDRRTDRQTAGGAFHRNLQPHCNVTRQVHHHNYTLWLCEKHKPVLQVPGHNQIKNNSLILAHLSFDWHCSAQHSDTTITELSILRTLKYEKRDKKMGSRERQRASKKTSYKSSWCNLMEHCIMKGLRLRSAGKVMEL